MILKANATRTRSVLLLHESIQFPNGRILCYELEHEAHVGRGLDIANEMRRVSQ